MRTFIAFTAGLAVWLTPIAPSFAQGIAFPDTPQGRLAARWFEAFNGTDEQFRALLEREGTPSDRPLDERFERWRPIRAEQRRFTPVRVLSSGPEHTTVLVRNGRDEWLTVTLETTPGDSPKFRGIGVEDASGDEQPESTGPMTEPQAIDSVRAFVESLARRDRFAGVVRLERAGRVVLEQAWGEADREKHVANRPDTRFNLGSINKTFTRAIIARLVEMGKLDPADKLAKHLPDFPRGKAEKISIQQLLDMSSGLGDIFGPRYDAMDRSTLRDPRDWFPLFVDQPLEFEPGTSRRYSNAGYVVLGAVAEALTGRSYYDLAREWIYAPAGMKATDSFVHDGRTPNLAVGYTRGGPGAPPDAPVRRNHDTLPGRGSPAGGGYSTAADLSRYARALEQGRILKPSTVATFYQGVVEPDGRVALGLGIAGGSPGCNALLETHGDWTLVVLANLDPPAAEAVGKRARAWLARVVE
jgi:CubicO group peptidase (beta-lactamase class C family)